ncbi:uncharacterized protein LOC120016938 isoform X1 [Tripterygium wilfordii]|uniref:uncharacterized protein LOC120016938 isoform X1 n=1 Tax=Tripterygium wilfordii TaxID=458696 RepID=UPI0018F7FC96|nr:uncharacterized protein LOC120016938 isoform X1 [Tripterygium wilfordii]XP_038725869.1 uncharacterized protein LOC120016938 isoform X1 [Tripterygium wilfordii]
MAADQRQKRPSGTITGCSSWDQYRTRKKRLESSNNDLNTKSHISLEWDGSQERVVAKKEQICISWRDIRPFVDSIPQCHNILADVVTIPQEIFDLENLTEVLSYQVWQTHLSENERRFLQQFLPSEQDAQQVGQALLGGDNFHFGNTFLKWGASLCLGNLHPDAVLLQEKWLKADKKAYYLELKRYHHDMIEYLQMLKGKWGSCKDSEKEIQQKTWRSRRDDGEGIFFPANGSRFFDLEDDVAATSNSSSSIGEDKASSSDNQNSSIFKGRELQKRKHKKGLKKDKCIYPLIASDHAVNVGNGPRKGGTIHKRNIQDSDGAEYMSYLKISKKQYELVKSMKESGKTMQSKTLNCVLGNHNSWHVQPFVVFEEEEQRKWQDHWLQLANKDIPAAYANWRQKRFQIGESIELLKQDMKNELKLQMENKKKGNREIVIQDQNDAGADDEPKNEEDSGSGSLQNQPQQISSLKVGHHLNATTTDAENNHIISRPGDASQYASRYAENANVANVPVRQNATISSCGDGVWSHSHYNSTGTNEYTSASGFSHPHQVNEGQRTRVIDLESDVGDEANRKILLLRQSDDGSFSSYPNHDQNEFLQSLFKGHGMLSCHHEQKQASFDFLPPNNVSVEDGQFHGHFQDQVQPLLPLEQGQKTENEGYMQRRMSSDIYSGGSRYLIPRQEHVPPLGVQDWTINSTHMPTTALQSNLNGGELLNQNWFPSEHQMRGSWSGSDGVNVPSQNIASGSNADQSLFSVLSQRNQPCNSSPYDTVGSNERVIFPRNYGIVGRGAPRMTNALSQGVDPINYLGERGEATPLMPDGMGWMSLQQNSALHDPMGKQYLGSWNQ